MEIERKKNNTGYKNIWDSWNNLIKLIKSSLFWKKKIKTTRLDKPKIFTHKAKNASLDNGYACWIFVSCFCEIMVFVQGN